MDERDELRRFIEKKHEKYGVYRNRWRLIHVLAIGVPVVFSWAAATIVKLQFLSDAAYMPDLVTILTAVTGLVVLLSPKLGADRKLYACQTARGKFESLISRLTLKGADLEAIQAETERINDDWQKEFGLSET